MCGSREHFPYRHFFLFLLRLTTAAAYGKVIPRWLVPWQNK